MKYTFRNILWALIALTAALSVNAAKEPEELLWDDMIPLKDDKERAASAISEEELDLLIDEDPYGYLDFTQPVKELDGKYVKVPGFVVPLDSDEGGMLSEFLLVPYYGACIHTPPPPPNQIVYVEATEAFTATSRFEPVWIEGTMQVGGMSKELYLVDGSADIHIGYSMNSARIEKYSNAPKAVVRPGPHGPDKEGV